MKDYVMNEIEKLFNNIGFVIVTVTYLIHENN